MQDFDVTRKMTLTNQPVEMVGLDGEANEML
jgi:hypothetical protein